MQNINAPESHKVSNIKTQFIIAGITISLVILLFWPTAQSIIEIWYVSETFTHGYFVLPVFFWLAWRCRQSYAAMPIKADVIALMPLSATGAFWLLSKLAGIQVGEQLALALILVFSLWAVLGRRIAYRLKFPLLFLLFLAPVGEELVPALMELTADMTVWAIQNTGIPIYREGLFFSLPSGNWSVVEACSGIRYLISSGVLGSLYAYLSYTSLRLRVAFTVIALVVPIFANSIRAYIIVMLGHFSGNKLATGVDHLVYGWVFFGIVMFVLFSIGGKLVRFDSRSVPESTYEDDIVQSSSNSYTGLNGGWGSYTRAIAAMFIVVASWPAWSYAINLHVAPPTTQAELGQQLLPKSNPVETGLSVESTLRLWQPINFGHDLRLEASYENSNLPTVRAIAFVYEQQKQGKEMISWRNVLVKSQDDIWRLAHAQTREVPIENGDALSIRESNLRSAEQRITIWQWYRVGNSVTSNPLYAKLLEVKDRLLLRNTPSVNYILAINNNSEKHREAALMSAMNTIFNL